MSVDSLVSAIGWALFSTIVAQLVSVSILWWLGLPPKKLSHEIEVVQNPAVGGCFFIISITASIFISVLASAGFTPSLGLGEELLWVAAGVVLASIYTIITFIIAHRVMGRVDNESISGYLRREIVKEQNVALAFFLGGLAVAPFIAIAFQII
jgi:hypothetical protein